MIGLTYLKNWEWEQSIWLKFPASFLK